MNEFISDLHEWMWSNPYASKAIRDGVSAYWPEFHAKVRELAEKHRIIKMPQEWELL